MLTKKEVYFEAYKELEKRRLNRKITKQKNIKIALKICPEIEILQRNISLTSINLAKLIYKKNYDFKKAINKIKKENLILQNKIKNLLVENNMPLNFLNPPPLCSICEDYGIVKNEKCSCLKKLINSITSKQLLKSSNIPKANFNNFNLTFYENNIEKNEVISSFNHMKAVFNECRKYAENFSCSSKGFLMHGLTGLGKTHLSLAIAFEIIEKGFTAIYETASQLTRRIFNSKYFNKLEDSYLNTLNDADLLIIDDLGCEFQSQINKSAIFEVINLRTSLNKPIIITTNLTPEELQKIYGSRIISRVLSTLTVLSFIGKDNRQKVNFT